MSDAPDPMDAAMAAAQAVGSAPAAPPSNMADPMDTVMAAAQSAPAPGQQTSGEPAQQRGPRGGQGRGQAQAQTQPALPAALTPQQTFQGAAQNFLPSLGRNVGAMANAVTHPLQTLGAVGQLGTGLISQAEDVAGIQQDPNTRARSQALLKSLEGQYGQRYGSMQGFAHAVASDPVSVLMDASTFLDGAGAAADAAKLGTVANVLHSMSPLGAVGKGAGLLAKGVTTPAAGLMRGAQSMWSGAPADALRTAAIAGGAPGPMRDAFTAAMKGGIDPGDYLTRAQKAVDALKQDRSNAYLATHADIANTPVSYDATYNALDQADQQLALGSPSQASKAQAVINEARSAVDEVANDPARQTVAHADALKKQMWDLSQSTNIPSAEDLLKGPIYNGVKSDITNVSPEYAGMMEQYQEASKNITNIQKTMIGAGNNPAASTALAKGLRAYRTGANSTLLDDLAAKDPTLPYSLAGASVSPWMRGGLQGLLEQMFSLGGIGGVLHNPVLAGMAWAGASPRLAGEINLGLGKLGAGAGALGKIGTPAAEAAYVGSQANPTQLPNAASAPANSNLSGTSYAQKVAQAEAAGNPNAKNLAGGNAVGLGQFTPQTWLNTVRRHRPDLAGLPDSQLLSMRTDPDLSLQMIDAYGQDNGQYLAGQGIPVNDATKYGSAWFGPKGFQTIYHADPNAQISDLASQLGLSAGDLQRNRFGGKTVGDIRGYIERHMGVPIESATGGRITAATGGKIEEGKSVEQLLEQLISRSEKLKRVAKTATKPLLRVPDNVVADALKATRQAVI